MEDVILGAWHGGLGDNLQLSSLPEQFYKQQGRKTYIWADSKFRNDDIYKMVWFFNPYICGIKHGERNAGDTPDLNYHNIAGDHIANIEQLHGLKPVNKYPKLYYKPVSIIGYGDAFLVDFSCISVTYPIETLKRKLEEIKSEFPNKRFVEIVFSKNLNHGKRTHEYDMNLDEKVVVDGLFDYYDLIANSYGIVALSSGASHMSSAIKEKDNSNLNSICIMEEYWYNKHMDTGKLFIYDNVRYEII